MARVVVSPIFVFICILNDASGDVFAPVDGGSHFCSLVLVKNCYGAHARLDDSTGHVSEKMVCKAHQFLELFRAIPSWGLIPAMGFSTAHGNQHDGHQCGIYAVLHAEARLHEAWGGYAFRPASIIEVQTRRSFLQSLLRRHRGDR